MSAASSPDIERGDPANIAWTDQDLFAFGKEKVKLAIPEKLKTVVARSGPSPKHYHTFLVENGLIKTFEGEAR
ncbi:MAG: hypothetical protein ACON4R_03595 [Akkermansiaceae bacterium]